MNKPRVPLWLIVPVLLFLYVVLRYPGFLLEILIGAGLSYLFFGRLMGAKRWWIPLALWIAFTMCMYVASVVLYLTGQAAVLR